MAVHTVIAGMTESLDFLAEPSDRIMEACAGKEISPLAVTANRPFSTLHPTVKNDPPSTHKIAQRKHRTRLVFMRWKTHSSR